MRVINQIRRFIAFIFLGCPICYNLWVIEINHYCRHCPKCNNSFDVRIWKE